MSECVREREKRRRSEVSVYLTEQCETECVYYGIRDRVCVHYGDRDRGTDRERVRKSNCVC